MNQSLLKKIFATAFHAITGWGTKNCTSLYNRQQSQVFPTLYKKFVKFTKKFPVYGIIIIVELQYLFAKIKYVNYEYHSKIENHFLKHSITNIPTLKLHTLFFQ